jgi:hypothetical protein
MSVPYLQFQVTTQFDFCINDSGSRANNNVSFWLPDVEEGYNICSLYATPNYNNPAQPSGPYWSCQAINDDPENPLLKPVVGLNEIWRSDGHHTPSNLIIYTLQAPPGYIGIGLYAWGDYNNPPTPNDYNYIKCVRQDQCNIVNSEMQIWNDQGSGASKDVSLWLLPSGNIYAYPGYPGSVAQIWDLKMPLNSETEITKK